MYSEEESTFSGQKHRIKGPFRLTTPSTVSRTRSPSATSSQTSATSSVRSRSRSPSIILTSDNSSTSSEDEDADDTQVPLTDTNIDPTEPPPRTITEAIHRAKLKGKYFPPDHFFAPPTPEQLRRPRKKKPRKLLYTFVRQRQQLSAKREVYVDPRVRKRVSVDRSKCVGLQGVEVPVRQVRRDEYIVNSAEFKPVEILGRVYKPSLRRRRRVYVDDDETIGIGGYIIRFDDGHQFTFPIHQLDEVIARYSGVLELIEEFEHFSMAMEDGDDEAIAYFDKQKGFTTTTPDNTSSINKMDTTEEEQSLKSEHSEHHT